MRAETWGVAVELTPSYFLALFIRATVRFKAWRLATQTLWLNSDAVPFFEEYLYRGMTEKRLAELAVFGPWAIRCECEDVFPW